RPRADRDAVATHPGLPPAARPIPHPRRGRADAAREAARAHAAGLFLGRRRRPAPVRLRARRQRAAVLRRALAGPPHGAQGNGLRDDPAAGDHRRAAALLGAGDVAGVARGRRAVGGRLRRVAADFRHDRVSLPDRRRLAARAPALRGAGGDAERGRPAAGDRARGDRDRARARQAGLSRGHERKQLLSVHRLEEMSTVALDGAAAIVSRRHQVTMASFTGHLAWEFLRGRYTEAIEQELGRPLTPEERRAFAEDAHGGWWETSLMLLLRPDLVDDAYRTLPPARYSWPERILPNYALRKGGLGYVGHPALADPAFARATTDVLMTEAMAIVDGLLDGTLSHSARRPPFSRVPLFRTNFWPATAGVTAGLGALAVGVAGFLLRRRPPPA